MLIRFSVENYNSFKERQVFSMVAGKQTRHPSHCLSIYGKRLLKSSFFFGANASGKTNFVRALDFMRRVTLFGSEAIRYNDRYFRIDSECKAKPGVFQIEFLTDQKVFSYGFALDYSSYEFVEEWLYRIEPSGKETCIFEREQEAEPHTCTHFSQETSLRFKIYYEDLNPNDLLLNVIGNKNLDPASELYDFVLAYKWFKKMIVVYPKSQVKNKMEFFLNRDADTDSLVKMLRAFDTGIEEIQKAVQPIEKAFSFLPDMIKTDLLNDLEQDMRKISNKDFPITVTFNGKQFEINKDNDQFVAAKIMLDHGNAAELFELTDESDGTRRLFDLLPLYIYGQKERIIIIDELDRSFHSKLTIEYIRRFFEITSDFPCQLVCTTHDLNLMDLSLLRQDEIWFVEREQDHSSKLYSLSDFKQRFDKNIRNDYLIGRYGALPRLSDSDWQEEYR